jgi:HSP20 family protein
MSTTISKSQPQAVPAAARNPLSLLRKEMDDLIARVWDGERERGWFEATFAPSVDLVEADNAFEVRMDIPGLEPKDIEVQVHGNAVTISGQRKEEKEERGKTFHRLERRSGSFSRTLSLPCIVNEDEVAADYTQGVLTVKLPKCEQEKPKRVTVKG